MPEDIGEQFVRGSSPASCWTRSFTEPMPDTEAHLRAVETNRTEVRILLAALFSPPAPRRSFRLVVCP